MAVRGQILCLDVKCKICYNIDNKRLPDFQHLVTGYQERITGMKCPHCQYTESKVIDSRPADDGERIRRRRECFGCGRRFTTYEAVETTPLMVMKKDHSMEQFDREKLLNGILRACEKRPVSLKSVEQIVERIEANLKNDLEREVTSQRIGELAMEEIRLLDEIAYVRFASVYRQFKDAGSFLDELNKIVGDKK